MRIETFFPASQLFIESTAEASLRESSVVEEQPTVTTDSRIAMMFRVFTSSKYTQCVAHTPHRTKTP